MSQAVYLERVFSVLAHLWDVRVENLFIESVLAVFEFQDVFSSNLLAIPLDRYINFCIDLKKGTHPISIPPYQMS